MNLKYVNFGGVFTIALLLQTFMPPVVESKPAPGRKGSMALGLLAGLSMGGAAGHFVAKRQMKRQEEVPPNCQKQIIKQQDPHNPGRYIETESIVCEPLEIQQPQQPLQQTPVHPQTVSSQAELSEPQSTLYPNSYVPQQQQQQQQQHQPIQGQQTHQHSAYPYSPYSSSIHPQPAVLHNSQSAEEQSQQTVDHQSQSPICELPKVQSSTSEPQHWRRKSPYFSSFIQRIRQRLAERKAQRALQQTETNAAKEQKPTETNPQQVAQAAAAQPELSQQHPVGYQQAIGFVPPPQSAQQPYPQSGQAVQFVQPPQPPTQQPEHVQSIQPAQPAHPVQPVQSVQPAQPAPVAEQAQPAQPVQTVQPAQPAQIAQPAQPAQSAQPIQPGQSAQPAHPAQQVQPVHPVQPMQPVAPVQPAQPVQPRQVFVLSKKTRYIGKSSADRILQTNLILMMMMAFVVIWWK